MSETQSEMKQEPKGKIMLVDDETMHRKLIKTVIGSKNYDYIEASSGLEAIEIFKTEKVDLILMDLNMPGLTGIETIGHIKKLDRGIETPVIMVTAHSNLDGLVQAIDYGAMEYIVKPFNHDELRAKVNAIYKFSQQQAELSNKKIEMEKLKLLQQAIITLSHYLNNAFSSVSLLLQTVDYNDTEKVKDLMNIVEKQIIKVSAVIKGMEEMAKSTNIKLTDYPGATAEMLDIDDFIKKYMNEN